MGLEQQLLKDMKLAMKAKEKVRLETVRGLRGQIKYAQIEKGDSLTEEEMIRVLMSAAKKRKEAIEQYNDLGRKDRAELETEELKVIESYLPELMSVDAIGKVVDQIIQQLNAASMKDMGKVMAAIMPKVKGKADGKLVQQTVKEKLSVL